MILSCDQRVLGALLPNKKLPVDMGLYSVMIDDLLTPLHRIIHFASVRAENLPLARA